MKKLLFVIGAFITSTAQPFRSDFDIDEMNTRTPADSQERMDTAKPKEPVEPAMPIRKPLRRPAHLSPIEQTILDTFEQQLAPLADGLTALTASPEARQARDAQLKEREQQVKDFLKRRSSEDRRWWQPSDSPYRPSHRGGFTDFSGDGWRTPTTPRIPAYWTPPTTGFSDQDFGSSPARDVGSDADQPGLATSDENTDDDDTPTSDNPRKGKGSGSFVESDKGKKIGEHLDTAINVLSNAADRIEKLNLTGTATDATARTLIDQEIIKDLSKAIKKADKEIEALSDDNKKAFTDKSDALSKQQTRVEGLYPQLLPHVLRAATMPTDDEDMAKQQHNMKRFIEQRIADKVSVATFNNALRTRQAELCEALDKMPKPSADTVTRSMRGKESSTDPRLAYIQRALKLMPTGRGDHQGSGRDNLIKRQRTIEAEIKAADDKANTEEVKAPVYPVYYEEKAAKDSDTKATKKADDKTPAPAPITPVAPVALATEEKMFPIIR